MSDSIIALGRVTVSAHHQTKNKTILYGRVELEQKDLTPYIGRTVKVIVCVEDYLSDLVLLNVKGKELESPSGEKK